MHKPASTYAGVESTLCHAEVSLSPPGTYQVTNQYAGAGGSFIFFICYDSRTTPFTINLSGTTILGTVRSPLPNVLCLDMPAASCMQLISA